MSIEHEHAAGRLARQTPVRCAVLTVSDTRTAATDRGGDTAERLLRAAGHQVVARAIVRDEVQAIGEALDRWLVDATIHAIVTTGGTGISRRDTTVEVVRRRLAVELEGFGELFRSISLAEIGAAAMMSRAIGGLAVVPAAVPPTQALADCQRASDSDGAALHADGPMEIETILFAVPGSVNAVETAVGRLIAPQLAHLIWERRR